jgi:type I restriction enzyme M protein
MRKSLGSKRKELSDEHITEITRLFGDFVESEKDGKPISRIFKTEDFGYRTITVERPMRDEAGKVVLAAKGKAKGKPQPDSSLRDTEKRATGRRRGNLLQTRSAASCAGCLD